MQYVLPPPYLYLSTLVSDFRRTSISFCLHVLTVFAGARPAGDCTCDRAETENSKPTGETCACGQRSADSCSCEKAADGGLLPGEVDFTTQR